ncbi:choice-of-anchor P family protein [Nocardioides sp. WS12]|uniref:choice-of-anchor P family protein n=1 Tax=Nocardioides sp. WS12 TaxID=2486272 RepID=UPI0015FCEE91|nr:choice-of-anchor P family protein [Nocardioides sp. WS12]
MKKTRTLASVASALVLVGGGASLALLGGGGTAVAAGQPSSAFGLELVIAGTAAIDKMPSVVSTTGANVTDELIDADALNPLLSGGVVQVSAQNGAASANVTGLGVGDGLLAMLPADLTTQLGAACTTLTDGLGAVTGPLDEALQNTLLPGLQTLLDTIADSTADSPIDLGLLGAIDLTNLTGLQLGGLCDVLAGETALVQLPAVVASCTGKTGDLDLVGNATALGLPLTIPTEPNGTVEIPGVVKIVANRQTNNADGTFTVDGLYLELLGQIQLTVASATCGQVSGDEETDDPSDAPSPTPIESHVPVTG